MTQNATAIPGRSCVHNAPEVLTLTQRGEVERMRRLMLSLRVRRRRAA